MASEGSKNRGVAPGWGCTRCEASLLRGAESGEQGGVGALRSQGKGLLGVGPGVGRSAAVAPVEPGESLVLSPGGPGAIQAFLEEWDQVHSW